MNQITTQYVTENGACYEQYVITDPAAKTALTITPERGGMITGLHLDPPPQLQRVQPPPLWRACALPQLRQPGQRRASL